MDHPAAPLLAADLGHLPHTNKRGELGYVQLPGFMSTAGMSEERTAEVGVLALGIAEAIIEDLDKHGFEVISKVDLKAKLQAAAQPKEANDVVLHCNRCQRPILRVDVSAAAPKLHVSTAVAGLVAHQGQCQ